MFDWLKKNKVEGDVPLPQMPENPPLPEMDAPEVVSQPETHDELPEAPAPETAPVEVSAPPEPKEKSFKERMKELNSQIKKCNTAIKKHRTKLDKKR
jgi:hypothetical protein